MLTIGEVARRAGLKTTTLRYYESLGLLPAPARESGQRRYEDSIFQRLALIKLAQRAGLRLAEIHTLLHDFSDATPPAERWQKVTCTKLEEAQVMLRRAQEIMLTVEHTAQCQCDSLDMCASQSP